MFTRYPVKSLPCQLVTPLTNKRKLNITCYSLCNILHHSANTLCPKLYSTYPPLPVHMLRSPTMKQRHVCLLSKWPMAKQKVAEWQPRIS